MSGEVLYKERRDRFGTGSGLTATGPKAQKECKTDFGGVVTSAQSGFCPGWLTELPGRLTSGLWVGGKKRKLKTKPKYTHLRIQTWHWCMASCPYTIKRGPFDFEPYGVHVASYGPSAESAGLIVVPKFSQACGSESTLTISL